MGGSGRQADAMAFRILEVSEDHPRRDLCGAPDPLPTEQFGLRQIARDVINLDVDDQARVALPKVRFVLPRRLADNAVDATLATRHHSQLHPIARWLTHLPVE